MMQHLFQPFQSRVGVAVYQIDALREPEVDVLDQARQDPLLAAEVAVYGTLAHTDRACEIANRERLHAVFGYHSTRSVNDLSFSYACGTARSYDHFYQVHTVQGR